MSEVNTITNISISYTSPGLFIISWNPIVNASEYTIIYTDSNNHSNSILCNNTESSYILEIPLDTYTFQIYTYAPQLIISDKITFNAPQIIDISYYNINNKYHFTWNILNEQSIHIIKPLVYLNNVLLDDDNGELYIVQSNKNIILHGVELTNKYAVSLLTELGEIAASQLFDFAVAAAFPVENFNGSQMLSQQQQQQPLSLSRNLQLPQQQQQPPDQPQLSIKGIQNAIIINILNYSNQQEYIIEQLINNTFKKINVIQKNNIIYITHLDNNKTYTFNIYTRFIGSQLNSNYITLQSQPKRIPISPQIINVYPSNNSIQFIWRDNEPTDEYIIQLKHSTHAMSLIDLNSKNYYNIDVSYILHEGILPELIPEVTFDKTTKTAFITNLITENLYNISLLATNSEGSSKKSNEYNIQLRDVPQKPTILSISGFDESLNIKWSYINREEAPIKEFNITVYNDTFDQTSNIPYLTGATTIGNLINNTPYNIYITAVNDFGESEPSVIKVGIPYNFTETIFTDSLDDNGLILTTIHNNPYVTQDYLDTYIDNIQLRQLETKIYKQSDTTFSVVNENDLFARKQFYEEAVIFKDKDNLIWIYNIITDPIREIESNVIVMTYTQNKRYGNTNINGAINVLDITQFDQFENRIVSNINDSSTYSTIVFEVNESISQFFIYKEIGDNIELLLHYNTIQNNSMEYINNNKYNGIKGRLVSINYTDNRIRLEYTGPVTKLILSPIVIVLNT
jgi:hypothetical protein